MAELVVKVGGSLEGLEDYVSRIHRFLKSSGSATVVLVIGGGQRVEDIRIKSRNEHWPDEKSHWAAVEAMSKTASEAGERLGFPVVNEISQLSSTASRHVVFDCCDWLRNSSSGPASTLPLSWSVTSDSIALALASEIGAEKLILLKSVEPGRLPGVESMAETGILDPHFPVLWHKVRNRMPLQVINFARANS